MAVFLSGHPIDLSKRYPDGTFSIRLPEEAIQATRNNTPLIRWHYRNEAELPAVLYITKCLKQQLGFTHISLYMPYFANARLDRVSSEREAFTLKYFADIINHLDFDRVAILDPHSSVTPALINSVVVLSPQAYIQRAIDDIADPELVIFYPDDGAAKRYSEMIKRPYSFGIKHRDWQSGKIQKLEITGNLDLSGKNVLIVDDICSRGGTAQYSAAALKAAGAQKIYCYFTHCEHSIFDGSLLISNLTDHIYTTNSIFADRHERMTVFELSDM